MELPPPCYYRVMNLLTKMVFLAVLMGGLTACTSLRYFETLTPGERAVMVCERQGSIRRLDADINRYGRLIRSARQAIATGYRLDEVCTHREVEVGTKTVCNTEITSKGEQRVCAEERQFQRKRICSNVRSRVDAATEQSNIKVWTQELASSQSQRTQRFQACFAEVSTLSAEEAYRRY